MVKKFLSVLLVISISLSLSIPAFAADETQVDEPVAISKELFENNVRELVNANLTSDVASNNDVNALITSMNMANISNTDREQIYKDVALLDKLGLFSIGNGKLVGIVPVQETENEDIETKFIYKVDYGDICEKIIVSKISKDVIQMIASDGRISNAIIFKSDGTMTIDGNDVYVLDSPVSSECILAQDIVTRSSDRFFQTTCPYGESSEYTHFVGNTNKADIELGTAHKNSTFSAVLTAITLVLAGPEYAIAAGFTSILWNYLKDAAPESHGLSFQAKKYWHNSCSGLSGGYISAIGKYVTYWCIQWFAKPQYQTKGPMSYEYEIHVTY